MTVYGQDYPTPDGTCIRDYVHVGDLADAHLLALPAAAPGEHRIYNLGNGTGFSVQEVIDAVREVTGHPVPSSSASGGPATPPSWSPPATGSAPTWAGRRSTPICPASCATPGTSRARAPEPLSWPGRPCGARRRRPARPVGARRAAGRSVVRRVRAPRSCGPRPRSCRRPRAAGRARRGRNRRRSRRALRAAARPVSLGEVIEVQQAVDLARAAGRLLALGGDLLVVLVVDLPDDLLDEVLEGDDPVGAAVLVDDDREVLVLAAHLAEGLRGPRRCRAAASPRGRGRPRSRPGRRGGSGGTGRGRARSRRRRPRRGRPRGTGTSSSRRPAWPPGWRSSTPRGTSTSVRGVMTSRTSRSPARKTSSISRRSSLLSDSCAATRSRSSSWLIDSPLLPRVAAEEPDQDVRGLREQPDDGAGELAIAFSGAATSSAKPSARCRASRLGVSSPTTSDR